MYPEITVTAAMKTSNSAEFLRKIPTNNCDNYHDNLKTPLLLRRSLSCGKKVRRLFLPKSSKVIMLWYFVIGIPFSIYLNPLFYLPNTDILISMVITCVVATAFLFSPISGFLADVKFSRFKVLKCSTYIMLAATISLLSFGVMIVYTVHNTGYYLLILKFLSILAVLLYGIGYVMFIANILQFGTSQLRDLPSQDSVTFLCWFFWTSSFGSVLSFSTHLPGHRSFIKVPHNMFDFDSLTASMDNTLLCLSIVSSAFILFVLHKRGTWFCTESVRENPYKLVYNVIKFACLNKRPIHRSAFTYCEDKLPSRMDLGKLRYGGHFTTEQVENVKVFLRIVMILFSLGPAFLMDVAVSVSTIKHDSDYDENTTTYKISDSTHLPGHRSFIKVPHNMFDFDSLTASMDNTLLCLSIVSSAFILFVLHKRGTWFCTESVRENPYKLVYNVIKFACLNKRPIHRSAFTYCEDKLPSRMDLGKLRYGGHFTTEQVENVKVFLRIVMILFSLGPAFLMDVAVSVSTIKHDSDYDENTTTYKISDSSRVLFLDYGMLSPLLVVVCIPVYLSIIRPFFSRCIPNMLKRMGLGIALLCITFALLIAFDITAYSDNDELSCLLNDSHEFKKKQHPVYTVIALHTLSSLYHMLLYIAAWEFICSQSPQSMKGLLFGLFYAIRGFYQSLATVLFLPFYYDWKIYIISCHSGYYMLNLCVGFVSLLVYTVVARRYKYRKRDDICNIYQYAERYYSNFQ